MNNNAAHNQFSVAFTSDIHIDVSKNNINLVNLQVKLLQDNEPNVFVLLGDLGSNTEVVKKAFKQYQDLKCIKLFVPGNHDIWIDSLSSLKKKKIDSTCKYTVLLKNIANDHGFGYLPEKPYVIGKTGFIGCTGWYDYSFRNKYFDNIISMHDYLSGEYKTYSWNDKKYAHWLQNPDNSNWKLRHIKHPDSVICDKMLEGIKTHLNQAISLGAEKIANADRKLTPLEGKR